MVDKATLKQFMLNFFYNLEVKVGFELGLLDGDSEA